MDRLVQYRASPVLHPSSNAHRVPSSPADPSFPSPAFPPKLDSPTHRRWEHRPFLQAASGAEPQDEVGGAPKAPLGRASLSGPFGSWPQEGPPCGDRRHLGGGRGRGLRAPGKGAGKISHHVCQAPGRKGPEGSGAPEATGDPGRGDDGPVRATEPKSEGWGGHRDPLSPRPAFPGLRRVRDPLRPVQFGGSGPHRSLVLPLACLALPELALPGVRSALSRDPECPRSGSGGVRSGRKFRLAQLGNRLDPRWGKVRIPSSPGGGAATVAWGTGFLVQRRRAHEVWGPRHGGAEQKKQKRAEGASEAPGRRWRRRGGPGRAHGARSLR